MLREQLCELLLGLPGKADDERAAQGEIRTLAAPAADARQRVLRMGRPAHALQYRAAAVLEGDVEVGQHAPLRHQRDSRINVRGGVYVMQAHPDPELTQAPRQIDETCLVGRSTPLGARLAQVRAVGTGVLRY